MRSLPKTSALLFGALSLALSACDETGSPPNPLIPQSSVMAGAGEGRKVRAEEAEFFDREREMPGFGGYYYDKEGNLVAVLRELGDGDRARARLEPKMNRHRDRTPAERRAPRGRVVARQGKYAFSELAGWRDLLSDSVLAHVDGVEFTDADERQNRVVVGVRDAATQGGVRPILNRLGIPGDAVHFHVTGGTKIEEHVYTGPRLPSGAPSFNAATGRVTGTLRSQDLAPMGGMQVDWNPNGTSALDGWTYCTLGFMTTYLGKTAGVTNAHCSADRGRLEETAYGYRGRGLGEELKDPEFGNNCDWMVWQGCKNADANIFGAARAHAAIGYIARPQTYHTSNSDALQYIVIDSSNPHFEITGTGDTRTGTVVDKVGVRTGWTYGLVERTCVDVSTNANTKFRCQHLAKYAGDNGDSGSPVFYWNGNTVELLGIHWGSGWNWGEMCSYYSSDRRIFLDLSTLPVTAVPLSATIEWVPGTYVFQAQPKGGMPYYTYEWLQDGVLMGTGDYAVISSPPPYTVQLRVTDAVGRSAQSSRYMSSGTAPAPPSIGPCTTRSCMEEPL